MGEFQICREYTKTEKSVFNVNLIYIIVYIAKDGIMTLKHTKTNILQSLEIQKVSDNFVFAYCTTLGEPHSNYSARENAENDHLLSSKTARTQVDSHWRAKTIPGGHNKKTCQKHGKQIQGTPP